MSFWNRKDWKTKSWNPLDIACLKWSSLLLGIVAGAALAEQVMPFLWPLLIASLLLAIRPALAYWKKDE